MESNRPNHADVERDEDSSAFPPIRKARALQLQSSDSDPIACREPTTAAAAASSSTGSRVWNSTDEQTRLVTLCLANMNCHGLAVAGSSQGAKGGGKSSDRLEWFLAREELMGSEESEAEMEPIEEETDDFRGCGEALGCPQCAEADEAFLANPPKDLDMEVAFSVAFRVADRQQLGIRPHQLHGNKQ